MSTLIRMPEGAYKLVLCGTVMAFPLLPVAFPEVRFLDRRLPRENLGLGEIQ